MTLTIMKKDGVKNQTFSTDKTKLRSSKSYEASPAGSDSVESPKMKKGVGCGRVKSLDDVNHLSGTTPNEELSKGNMREHADSLKRKLSSTETGGDYNDNEIQNNVKKIKQEVTDEIMNNELAINEKDTPKTSDQLTDTEHSGVKMEPKAKLEKFEYVEGKAPTEYNGNLETVAERREKRKAKSKYNSLDNDDLERMLKWKNGVGHLAGSNLKFRKSHLGSLEVITPSSDEEDERDHVDGTLSDKKAKRKGSRKQLDSPSVTNSPLLTPKSKKTGCGGGGGEQTDEKKKRKDRKKKKRFAEDELLKCETCGCYGLISEFRSSGRFCSQRCVGAYASKRRAEMIAEQFASGERPLPKSCRKTIKKRKSYSKDMTPSQNSSPTLHKRSTSPPLLNGSIQHFEDDSTIYYQKVGYNVEFDWNTYLAVTNSKPADHCIFIKEYPEQELFPINDVYFKPAMKLECVDPKHQSHICVVSVVEVQGARMRLHFDGWSESYDFWINCDSPFLHPCGWCRKNGQMVTPPRGMTPSSFGWSTYLFDTGCEAAPEHLFHQISPTQHGLTTNMKLEAVDRKNPDLICVASITNVIGNHFLIHFDEWDDQYDYWCKDDSPFIHPVGWCQEKQVPLVPPTDEMVNKFVWKDYLNETNTIAAPRHIFKQFSRQQFEVGTKLEVIDPRNPSLARVSTVCIVEDYRVKVHFDGWDEIYDCWFDYDSTDLHPVNWCKKTGHQLEPPPCKELDDSRSCVTPGCRGIGHIKGLKYTTHHTSFGCPYTLQNLNRSTSPVVDRLAQNAINEETSISNRVYKKRYSCPVANDGHVLPDSTTKDVIRKPRHTFGGRPTKKYRSSISSVTNVKKGGKVTLKRRKRRRSDEVSSSTSPSITPENVQNNRLSTKPISSTHRPAGQFNLLYQQNNTSKAVPWSSDDVSEFLKNIGYEDLVACFKDNQIDGPALLLLSQADLVHHMKLKLGPALKIYSEISKL